MAEISTGKPYTDEHTENCFIRTFDEAVDPMELVWHRDKKDRVIEVLEGSGWLLQYDNSLPTVLEKNKLYTVKAETYHRVLKGQGKLIIKVKEE